VFKTIKIKHIFSRRVTTEMWRMSRWMG